MKDEDIKTHYLSSLEDIAFLVALEIQVMIYCFQFHKILYFYFYEIFCHNITGKELKLLIISNYKNIIKNINISNVKY